MKLPDLKEFTNIAIIQTAFLGDVALALPLAQMIKNNNAECKITFVTTPSASPLAASVAAIDKVVTFDKRGLQTGYRGIKFIAETLKSERTECIITLHRSIRSTLLTYLSRPYYSVGFNKSALSLLYDKRIKYKEHLHEFDRNLSLLKAFKNHKEYLPLESVDLDINNEDKSFVDSKLIWAGFEPQSKIVAVAPGSIWETKKWKEEYFIKLIELLKENGYSAVLIGSESDKSLCGRIALNSGDISFAGDFSLPQTLYFLSLCSLTITNDSAPTHFAGLVKCPTITIFGPTSPIFGFTPRGNNDKVIEIKDLDCRPCAIHGGKICPKNTHECMKSISPELVFKEALEILNNS